MSKRKARGNEIVTEDEQNTKKINTRTIPITMCPSIIGWLQTNTNDRTAKEFKERFFPQFDELEGYTFIELEIRLDDGRQTPIFTRYELVEESIVKEIGTFPQIEITGLLQNATIKTDLISMVKRQVEDQEAIFLLREKLGSHILTSDEQESFFYQYNKWLIESKYEEIFKFNVSDE